MPRARALGCARRAGRGAAICVLLSALCGARPAFGQTGAVLLTVDQAPDATATLEASDSSDPPRRWSMAARGNTTAALDGLPPAVYRILVTLLNRPSLNLTLTLANAEVITLAVDAGGNDLRVVDRRRRPLGTYLDARQLRDVPLGSGVASVLDAAAPFVITDGLDTGGLRLGTIPRVGSRAASWVETKVVVGGIESQALAGMVNLLGQDPALENVQEMPVVSGMATPDVAGAGTRITFVPRLPPAERLVSANLFLTTPRMVSANDGPAIPSIARVNSWTGGDLQVGGPARERVGLLASGSATVMKSYERDIPEEQSSRLTSFFAHLTSHRADDTQWRWLIDVADANRPYGGLPQFRAANVQEHDLLVHSQLTWDRQNRNGSHVEWTAAYEHGTYDPSATLPDMTSIDRALDGLIPDPASTVASNRLEGRLTFHAPVGHRQMWQAGVSVARSTAAAHTLGTPSMAERVAGLSARVWVPGVAPPDSHRAALNLAGYLEDRIAVADRLSVDLGLNLGRSSGQADGAAESVAWNAILPRVNVRWALPFATFFGSYGRYQDDVPLRILAFGDPGAPVFDVYRWIDANANGRFDPGEKGALVARAGHGSAIGSIDPALQAPYTDEFVIGVERMLGSKNTVSAAIVSHRERSLLRSVNVGVPISSYTVKYLSDPAEDYGSAEDDRLLAVYDRLPSSFGQDRYVLMNSPDEVASYDATEVTWQLRGVRWWSMAGASAYRTWSLASNPGVRSDENDPGVIGALLENPNANSYARGASLFDRQFVLKWSTAYHAPHDVLLSAVARYQDGQPLSRVVVASGLAQGPELVNAYRSGRTRFQFTATLDARVEKGFSVAGHRASLRLEIYNLPNLGNEVEENPVYGSDFRRTRAVQPPRAIRLGLHMQF